MNLENFDKSLKKLPHEPLAWMHWYLAWNIIRTRRFIFVQM